MGYSRAEGGTGPAQCDCSAKAYQNTKAAEQNAEQRPPRKIMIVCRGTVPDTAHYDDEDQCNNGGRQNVRGFLVHCGGYDTLVSRAGVPEQMFTAYCSRMRIMSSFVLLAGHPVLKCLEKRESTDIGQQGTASLLYVSTVFA